jgi:hypothetical protein
MTKPNGNVCRKLLGSSESATLSTSSGSDRFETLSNCSFQAPLYDRISITSCLSPGYRARARKCRRTGRRSSAGGIRLIYALIDGDEKKGRVIGASPGSASSSCELRLLERTQILGIGSPRIDRPIPPFTRQLLLAARDSEERGRRADRRSPRNWDPGLPPPPELLLTVRPLTLPKTRRCTYGTGSTRQRLALLDVLSVEPGLLGMSLSWRHPDVGSCRRILRRPRTGACLL